MTDHRSPLLWQHLLAVTLLTFVATTGGVLADPIQPETLHDVEAKLESAPDDVALLSAQGAMLRQAKDYKRAVEVYEHILALTPEDIRSRNLLVLVLHQAAQEADSAEALSFMRRAVTLAPDADFLKPDYLKALQESGVTTELISAYEALPAGYELAASMLISVADAYRENDRLAEAEAIYRTVLNVAPTDPDAGLGLALTLLDDQRFPEALAVIQRTINHNPGRPTLLLALAAIQWQSGTRTLALDTFDRILAIDPTNADAVNLKAQLLCDMGCISLARDVIATHPALVWTHVRRHVLDRTAEAQASWGTTDALTNALPRFEPDTLLALCYFNVTKDDRSATTITAVRFLQHIEYLRTHNYHFVSAGDVAAARRGEKNLPENAVLMTFDHGYADLLNYVIPVLELYNIPAIISVCPAWIENGPPMDLSGPLLTWEQVMQLTGHRLITLGIEAEGLFELIRSNPQGDAGFAALTCMYDAATGRYESETDQRERLHGTLNHALRLMKERAGVRPRVLVWSHGARNAAVSAEAERLGFALQLGLRAQPHLTDTETLERTPVLHNPDVAHFVSLAKPPAPPITHIRAVSVPMDRIHSPSDLELDRHITRLIERLRTMEANTVLLAACADTNGDGTVEAAYFPTLQLPVLHDALDHVVARLQSAGFRVMLELPVLSFMRPATPRNDTMRVMEMRANNIRPSFSLQQRYSPFHPEFIAWVSQLYRDLARHVRCDGIVFGEDAYLTDTEDYNPSAQKLYATQLGTPFPGTAAGKSTPEQMQMWMRIKTETLNRLTLRLGDDVKRYRPDCALIRTLYAPILHYPESERWLAQNYADSLTLYDRVLLMAYVEMEDVRLPEAWLASLVEQADALNNGLEKTIFKLQAVDWERNKPVKGTDLDGRLRRLARSGALHLSYGPDTPLENKPAIKAMRHSLAEPTRPRK